MRMILLLLLSSPLLSIAAPSVSTFYCTSDCSSNAIHEFASTPNGDCVPRGCAEDPWPGVYSVVTCPDTLEEPTTMPIRKLTFENVGCTGSLVGYAAYADNCFECDPFTSVAPATSARCDASSAIHIDFQEASCGGSSCSVEQTPLWGAANACNGNSMIKCDSALPKPGRCPTPAPTQMPTTSTAPTLAAGTSGPTPAPTTSAGPTPAPTQTEAPTTSAAPTTPQPTTSGAPTTGAPTAAPTTGGPTAAPTTGAPTDAPTDAPTAAPTTASPTTALPTTATPTGEPTSAEPTEAPSQAPSSMHPTVTPGSPTKAPTSEPTAATEAPTPAPTYPCVEFFDNTTNTTISNCTNSTEVPSSSSTSLFSSTAMVSTMVLTTLYMFIL